jgi:two-component system NtrC family response regulator
MTNRVLIIDDEETALNYLARFFKAKGYETAVARTGAQGLELAGSFSPDVVLLDLQLPDADGMDLLVQIKQESPSVGVIMITGHGDVDTAVRAMRTHADHFVLKPIDLDVLESIVGRVIRSYQQRDELTYLRGRGDVAKGGGLEALLPEAIANEIRLLAQGAGTSVLILGETGTGKGVVARLIHDLSPRHGAGFVDINCAGLNGALLESELFGHEPGAFTGATTRKRGLLELASGGTLFLDEIGDMPLEIQAKLLKVIEERSFRRVGSTQSIHVDVRIIAATNVDLAHAARQGKFRQDLYYRLSVVPVTLPPLRARAESIPGLARQFVAEYGRSLGKPTIRLSSEGERLLCAHQWPGNVRELRNAIERAVLLCQEDEILPRHLPEELRTRRRRTTSNAAAMAPLAHMEKMYIQQVLDAVHNNHSQAAEVLGVHRATLITKIKKYGLS